MQDGDDSIYFQKMMQYSYHQNVEAVCQSQPEGNAVGVHGVPVMRWLTAEGHGMVNHKSYEFVRGMVLTG